MGTLRDQTEVNIREWAFRRNQRPSNEDEQQDGPLIIALGWIGVYDGSGELTVGGDRQQATDLVLRIALDADSIASASCPACVTVILDPWFAGGGQTANVLTVKLRHETAPSAGLPVRTLVDGDLEFRKR